MVRGFLLMTCVLLALSVPCNMQAADSITVNETMLNSTLTDAKAEYLSPSGGVSGDVIDHLLAAQTRMQNQIADCASSSSVSSMKADLEKTASDLQRTKKKLQKTEEKLQAAMNSALKSDQGSTFVRWGRKTCPANTTMVYSGVAGGKSFSQKGSGSNRLCLTRSPQFDNTTAPSFYGYLYGGEYQDIGNHVDHDVPCSVCRAPQSTTIMMAATLTCPPGWTAQYTGYLTSEYKDHYAAEYVCLDGNPENYSGGLKNDNGLLFYHVITVCGSLPCPPYTNNKVVTCVICSRFPAGTRASEMKKVWHGDGVACRHNPLARNAIGLIDTSPKESD